MENDAKTRTRRQPQREAIEPVTQEDVPFHDSIITAVTLEDGEIAVVVRWVCELLHLDPQAQTQRIQRTESLANEIVYVKVWPRHEGRKGGGRQPAYAIKLRGFSPWLLGINPSEVQESNPEQAECIRALIIAFQEEAKDALYDYFLRKRRLSLPSLPEAAQSSTALLVRERVTALEPVKPQEPAPEASDEELSSYYEDLTVWAYWKSKYHAQKWRSGLDEWRGTFEARMESQEALSGLLPEIIARLGPETITTQQERQVQALVHQLHEATGKHQGTIYNDLKTAFGCPRYQELKAHEWPQVLNWFQSQIERAKKKSQR